MSSFAQIPVPEAPELPVDGGPPAEPLDFAGALLVAPERAVAVELEGEETAAARCAALLTAHSFGEGVRLFPDEAAAWRVALHAIRAHHQATGRPKRRELLVPSADPRLPPALAGDAAVVRVPPVEGALVASIGPKTAGIFLSPVSIAAGLDMLSGAVLAEARGLADEYGIALVFDETDAGLGRTGMAFAHEWRGVTPDLMLVRGVDGADAAALVLTARFAKSLPGGLPALPEETAAAVLQVLATALAPEFEARVQGLGWQMEDRLATLRWRRADLFRDTIGTGLLQGLLCAGPAADWAERLAQGGLLARPLGDVLAFLPPLTVTEAEIAAAMDILDAAAAAVEPVPG